MTIPTKYHYAPIKVTKIKNNDNVKCGGDDAEQLCLPCVAGDNAGRHRHFAKLIGCFYES